MKIDCNQIKDLILTSKIDEVSSDENKVIFEHINLCNECKNFLLGAKKAEKLIAKLKKTAAFVQDEEFITSSIIERIKSENKIEQNFLNHVLDYFSTSKVKAVLASILLVITVSFTYFNYLDAEKISNLEKRFSGNWNRQMNCAAMLSKEVELLNYVYNAYRLINGTQSFFEVNKSWVILKREDIRQLLTDYSNLDEDSIKRLLELKANLLNGMESDLKISLSDKIELQKTIRNLKVN